MWRSTVSSKGLSMRCHRITPALQACHRMLGACNAERITGCLRTSAFCTAPRDPAEAQADGSLPAFNIALCQILQKPD